MGTIWASAYASILMASFESKYIYPYIIQKVITILRFIDDVIIICFCKEEEVLKFIIELNQ